ncbi:lanthionine synthetase LanC family protein [uncultured Vagococcus sp.]|uniref:lanthionine synthetase LanC family protein n=1 Tax=uncultured Vagococcus sp. TaxID=189676 RepID=UPI0028D74EB6|nr:lanthionine synthetase LanC family protein [uncultured Vagococcus sp.]
MLFILLQEEEKAIFNFEKSIEKIKWFTGPSLNNGILKIACIANIINANYGTHVKLSGKFNESLNRILKNSKFPNRLQLIDSLDGFVPVARYLLSIGKIDFDLTKFNEQLIYTLERPSLLKKRGRDIKEPESYIDLGVPHGLAGTLFYLSDLSRANLLNTRSMKVIDEIFNLYNRNFKIIKEKKYINSIVTSDQRFIRLEDILLKKNYFSWCYGTLGIYNSLMYANGSFNNEILKSLISEIKQQIKNEKKIISREIDDYGFCHGYSGTLYMLNKSDSNYSFDKVYSNLVKYIGAFHVHDNNLHELLSSLQGFMSSCIISSLLLLDDFESIKQFELMYLL